MSDLELLKRYLQNEIDTGNHKMFAFDKDDNFIEFKTIDVLNEVNNLQQQLQQKENIIKEARENIEDNWQSNYFVRYDDNVYKLCDETLEILDKGEQK